MIKNFCKFHNGKLFVIHLNAFLNSKIFIEFFTRLGSLFQSELPMKFRERIPKVRVLWVVRLTVVQIQENKKFALV